MSGSIQSSDYVPGVSGWALNADGSFEFNSCNLGSAANAPDRQMVSVEVSSWSKCDLPKNAAKLLQFMQAELQKVPEQYRHAAEFEEYDASYGDESFNARLFLSYSRLETEEELADRLKKAKLGGTRTVRAGGCTTGIVDGVVRWRFGDLSAPVDIEPFKVVDGVTYVNKVFVSESCVSKSSIASAWPAAWGVRMQLGENGNYYAAGIEVGLPSQFVVSADRFAVNGRDASEILRDIGAQIGKTQLCRQVLANTDQLGSSLADQVKELIRKELIPGGLLHRWR